MEKFKNKNVASINDIVTKMIWNVAVCSEADKDKVVVAKQIWFTFGYDFLLDLTILDEKLTKIFEIADNVAGNEEMRKICEIIKGEE